MWLEGSWQHSSRVATVMRARKQHGNAFVAATADVLFLLRTLL